VGGPPRSIARPRRQARSSCSARAQLSAIQALCARIAATARSASSVGTAAASRHRLSLRSGRHSSVVEQLFRSLPRYAQCYKREGPIQTGIVISCSFRGVARPGSPLRPVSARADPYYLKSSHKSVLWSIFACSREPSETGSRSRSKGRWILAAGRVTAVSRLRAPEAPRSPTDDDSDVRTLNRADNYRPMTPSWRRRL
jgi:hypothetical protein